MNLKGKTALIAGASGLIGSELLHILLKGKEYDRVVAIVRSPMYLTHPKLIEKVVDFNQLNEHIDCFKVDDVFCCLGTTIKKAKTKDAMKKIDVEYPLNIAKIAKEQGAKQYVLVSSMNANPNSTVFYSKIKGILEQELMKIPYESISIMRPSLLLGNRMEFRLGEKVAGTILRGLGFLFFGPLKKYKAVKAEDVALAMYKIAQNPNRGTTIYSSKELESISVSGK